MFSLSLHLYHRQVQIGMIRYEEHMITTPLFLEFEDLRQKCRWFLLLGILMLVLGTVAFIIAPAATIGTI